MNPLVASGPEPCSYCGTPHTGQCPKIKVIEYWPDGSTKRVEFHDGMVMDSTAPPWHRSWPNNVVEKGR